MAHLCRYLSGTQCRTVCFISVTLISCVDRDSIFFSPWPCPDYHNNHACSKNLSFCYDMIVPKFSRIESKKQMSFRRNVT